MKFVDVMTFVLPHAAGLAQFKGSRSNIFRAGLITASV